MRVGFLGAGKLGLPCALAVESRGHEVMVCDPNPDIALYLRDHFYPHWEEGLLPLLEQTKIKAVDLATLASECDLIFVPIQTPHKYEFEGVTALPMERADFDYMWLREGMAALDKAATKDVTVSIISTCLPGTIRREILPDLKSRKLHVVYNPFFIAMGTTIHDFLNPEFVLLGCDDAGSEMFMTAFYSTIHSAPVMPMSIESAELAKVAYNTMIGTKIVVANTMMEICHKIEKANVDAVMGALKCATDRIISPRYMDGGMGDGGGCHPRDNIAMSWLARKLYLSHDIFSDIMICREDQTYFLIDEIERNAVGQSVLILGKAYKPETNLTYGSPALLLYNLYVRHRERLEGLQSGPHFEIDIYDPFVDIERQPPIDRHRTFFIATKHKAFTKLQFPQGSVIIDPFRYMPDVPGSTVIRIGQ